MQSIFVSQELYMIPSMRSLTAEEYVEAFKTFLDHSTEHQCMDEFNKEQMPNIVAGWGALPPRWESHLLSWELAKTFKDFWGQEWTLNAFQFYVP